MIRATSAERIEFREICHPAIKAAAEAMYERIVELGFRPPYAKDDGAWHDLADFALKAAAKAQPKPQAE